MDHSFITAKLENNAATLKSLLAGLSPEEYTWKEKPEKWCLLEVVCHLYDEEREDFRARIMHTLETPHQPMPAINPAEWVTSRNYMQQDFEDKLDAFLQERTNSINWLRSLQNPNWNSTYEHPKMGKLRAQLFLDNWLAHDYLHIRQITAIKYRYLCSITKEPMDYAGNW